MIVRLRILESVRRHGVNGGAGSPVPATSPPRLVGGRDATLGDHGRCIAEVFRRSSILPDTLSSQSVQITYTLGIDPGLSEFFGRLRRFKRAERNHHRHWFLAGLL
jgi:hypothetical protein